MKKGRLKTCRFCNHKFRTNLVEEWDDKKICPSCKTTYCDKPETEKQLFDLQDELVKDFHNQKVIAEMLDVLISYSKSIILELLKGNSVNFGVDIDTVAYDSAVYLLEGYYSKENWKISGSFHGYLKYGVRYILYEGNRKSVYHLNFLRDENGVELDTPLYSNCDSLEGINNSFSKTDYVDRMINSIFIKKNLNLSVLIAINIFLRDGQAEVDKFFEKNKSANRYKATYLHLMNKLKKELLAIYDEQEKEYALKHNKNFIVRY